ncbi:MAG: hypothetical protein ACI4WY_04965 [Anaerovoracaceae bacterium]
MTELIREQLGAMGLMACGGMAAGLLYELFYSVAALFRKTDFQGSTGKYRVYGILAGILEVTGLFLIGWCSSVFLYYSSDGKITLQGIVSFFAGLWIWKKQVHMKEGEKEYGEERKSAAGIRKESPGAGYHQRTEREAEEKKQPKAAGRKRHRFGKYIK